MHTCILLLMTNSSWHSGNKANWRMLLWHFWMETNITTFTERWIIYDALCQVCQHQIYFLTEVTQCMLFNMRSTCERSLHTVSFSCCLTFTVCFRPKALCCFEEGYRKASGVFSQLAHFTGNPTGLLVTGVNVHYFLTCNTRLVSCSPGAWLNSLGWFCFRCSALYE